jgi:hypothetical protein
MTLLYRTKSRWHKRPNASVPLHGGSRVGNVGPSSRGVARCEAKADHEFLARMSYVEIYNEEARSRTLTHAHGRTQSLVHTFTRTHACTHARELHVPARRHERARRRAPTGRAVRQVKDLLDDSGTVAGGLAVVEDPKTGPYVKGAVDKARSSHPHAPACVRTASTRWLHRWC